MRFLRGVLLLACTLSTPAFAQAPGTPSGPPLAPGQRPLPVQPLPVEPVPVQPLPPEAAPAAPGEPSRPSETVPPFTTTTPTTTTPSPVPVIPEVQQIGPPVTIPSTPQRVLPAAIGLPAAATFQFQPSVTLMQGYTDNFNLTRTDKQENFRSSIAPGILFGINATRVKGLIAYTFMPAYDTALDDVSYFQSLLAQVVWQANPRWQLTLADTFTKSDEAVQADRLGLRQERRDFTSNTLSLTSDYLIGRVITRQAYQYTTFNDDSGNESGQDTRTHRLGASATIPIYLTNSASVGYEYVDSKTDQSGGTTVSGGATTSQNFFSSDSFKVRGHQFTAGASRQLSPITTVGLRGSYALRTGTDQTGDEDFQLWNFAGFARYILPGRLTLDGSAGVTGASSDSSGSVGPNFFTVTSASYQLGRALISLGFDSGFSETFTEGQNFGVVETKGVIASFSYAITPAISATLSGSWRRNEPTGIGDAGIQSDTTTWTGSAGFSWRIQRRLLLDLTYVYTDQTDNRSRDVQTVGTDGGYTENRVQAALRVVY
jgi:hypothetical protein